MEKLIIRILQLTVVAALVGIAAPVTAGQGFRLSSQSPKASYHAKPAHRAYVFGYGGIDTGAKYRTTGAFDDPGDDPYGVSDWESFPINFDLSNGWTAGGGVGIYSHIFGGSRFEIEGSHTRNGVDSPLRYDGFLLPADFKMSTSAVMFNYLKEIPFERSIAYIGGGVGYASTRMSGDIDTIDYSHRDSGFAWQLIAGIDFPITERLALFTQYRYLVLSNMGFTTDFGDFTFKTDSSPSSHAVLVGARLSF